MVTCSSGLQAAHELDRRREGAAEDVAALERRAREQLAVRRPRPVDALQMRRVKARPLTVGIAVKAVLKLSTLQHQLCEHETRR